MQRIDKIVGHFQPVNTNLTLRRENVSCSKPILGDMSCMNDDFQLNVRTFTKRASQIQPDTEIVTKIQNGYHRTTYKKIDQLATQLASALSKAGIKIGDRVGTFMFNNHRHLTLYYSVPCIGAVLHTLNIRLHSQELDYIINHAEDKVIFVDAPLLEAFEKIPSNTLNNIQKIIVCGYNEQSNNWKSKLTNVIDYDDFLLTGDNHFDWPNIDERSTLGLCYTSGTTGNPKGVGYSHRSTYLHTLVFMGTDLLNISGSDCFLPVVPMFHCLAWCTPYVAYCLGLKLLLLNDQRRDEDLAELICQENCTIVAGVPTVLQGLKNEMERDSRKYRNIKGTLTRAMCGGACPPASLIEWYWKQWNIEVIHGWGMTEMNPLGTLSRRVFRRKDLLLNDEERLQNQLKQGILIPTVEGKILDSKKLENGEVVELPWDGESTGELIVKGPTVNKNYYKVDAKEKFINGWLITGDIGLFTKNSELILKDRSKDIIKSGGEWISSIDMENYVMSLPQIDKACVVAQPHPKWDERPIVIVQLKPNQNISKEEIIEYIGKKFEKFQLPDDVLFWKEIPLTGSGKMVKNEVRKILEKQQYVLPSLRK